MNDNDIEIIDVDTNNNPESNCTVIYESDNMNNKPRNLRKSYFLLF